MIDARMYPTFAAAFRAALKAYRLIEHEPGARIVITGVKSAPAGIVTLKRGD